MQVCGVCIPFSSSLFFRTVFAAFSVKYCIVLYCIVLILHTLNLGGVIGFFDFSMKKTILIENMKTM